MKITIEAIGRIHTNHTSKDKAPIQGVFQPDAVGTVEIFPEFAAVHSEKSILF
jgi:tRNA (Thr-GGU) A37 N-methylase